VVFADRAEAGARLAAELERRRWLDPVVLGLARGGVPVADAVARRLDAPLEVAVARKIGAPGRPEFGIGAVTPDGPAIYHRQSLDALGITADDLADVTARERAEARRRAGRYRNGRTLEPVQDRDVILVDDGLATGVTATAVLRALREQRVRSVVFAAPACAPPAASALLQEADDVVCVAVPDEFVAVGRWYADFGQTSDDEVVALLEAARHRSHEGL